MSRPWNSISLLGIGYCIPESAGTRGAKQHGIQVQAKAAGVGPDEIQSMMEAQTLLHRLPTLAEVANVATFVVSDQASAMTGTVANLSAGSIAD